MVRVLDGIEDASGPAMADQTLAYLRRVMNWHEGRADDFRSPIVRSMGRTLAPPRDRILTDGELRAVWAASAEGMFGGFVRFLLLTGCRRQEAAGMRWSEIAGSEWTLPPRGTDQGRACPPPQRGRSCRAATEGRPVCIQHRWRRNGNEGLLFFLERFNRAAGVSDWTLHDLRRTARSLMSRAGVASDHAERCLGHAIGGVRGVYDRHRYVAEMARAYEALAAQIDRIVSRGRTSSR